METSERLNSGESNPLKEPGHFRESVKADIVAYRIVSASIWSHDDKAHPHAARRKIERPMFYI